MMQDRTVSLEDATRRIEQFSAMQGVGGLRLFPFADQLDPAKVRDWLQHKLDACGWTAYAYTDEEIKALVR